MNIIKSIKVLFLLLFCIGLKGQVYKNINFHNFTKEKGLPSNFVNEVIKDNLGFLWVATSDGLCQYYGSEQVQVYKVDTSLISQGLASNYIKCIYWDSQNNLWIGTRLGGLTRYQPSTNSWRTFKHQDYEITSISHNDILSIYEDSQRRLWVGTENGLNLFNAQTETFTNISLSNDQSDNLSSGAVLDIMEDKQGWIWLGTWGGGLQLLIPDSTDSSSSFQLRSFNPDDIKSRLNVWKIYQDAQDRYWLGTHGNGLFLMQLPPDASNQVNKQEWQPKFHNYVYKPDNTGIGHNIIYDIIQDKNGGFWLGTVDGLSYSDDLVNLKKQATQKQGKPALTFYTYRFDSSNPFSLIGNAVHNMLEDEQGLLWFSTTKGISQYNWQANQFNYLKFSSITGELPNAQSIYVDEDQHVWMATYDKGLCRYSLQEANLDCLSEKTPDLLLGARPTAIYGLPNHQLIVGTKTGITLINRKTLESNHYPIPKKIRKDQFNFFIQTIMVDNTGLIWLGTEIGLFTLHPKSGVYTLYLNNPKDKSSISDNSINDILQDSFGTIWIATYKGLNKVITDKAGKINFEQFLHDAKNPQKRLPYNQIIALEQFGNNLFIGSTKGLFSYNLATNSFSNYPDRNNNFFILDIQKGVDQQLWMSTTEGLVTFNPQKLSFKAFYQADGIGKGIFRLQAGSQDKKGTIYFGSHEGITYFHPNKILNNKLTSEIYITNIKKVNAQATAFINGLYEKSITLSHKDYYLSLDFATPDYRNTKKIPYAYKLEGFDDTWHYTNLANPIIYTSLPPETYQLKIKRVNKGALQQQNDTVFTIKKLPAFWQTWWFKILSLLLLGGLIGIIIKYYTRSVHNRNQLLKQHNTALNKQIEERKKIAKVLASREKFLRLIMDSVPQFIGWVDKDFRILGSNKILSSFLNLKDKKDMVGKLVADFPLPSLYKETLFQKLTNVLASQTPIINEVSQLPPYKNLPPFWIEQSFIPLFDDAGEVFGILICGSDITKRVQHEKMAKSYTSKLQEFNEELKRSNKDLEQFAYIASHDLQEPLRIIGNFVGLLAQAYKTKLDQDAFTYIDFIETGVQRMSNLITSLLTYSRVGRQESQFEKINLNRLLEHKLVDLSQLIKEKNAKVTIKPLPEIFGESSQIGMVFQNLIINALKFNKSQQPTVFIKEEKSNDPNFWQFSIADNGIGIAPEYQKQIFGIFRRLHGKEEYEGTGIGLSICHKVIFRHKGTIWVESERGKGANFRFTIAKKIKKMQQEEVEMEVEQPMKIGA